MFEFVLVAEQEEDEEGEDGDVGENRHHHPGTGDTRWSTLDVGAVTARLFLSPPLVLTVGPGSTGVTGAVLREEPSPTGNTAVPLRLSVCLQSRARFTAWYLLTELTVDKRALQARVTVAGLCSQRVGWSHTAETLTCVAELLNLTLGLDVPVRLVFIPATWKTPGI